MEQYSVYMHVNKVNDKKYIGITKQTPEARWGTNGRNYQNRCPHFWSSIQKYGWNNFEHIVVASGLSKEDACNMEIDLIAKYRTQDKNFGYNILEGGTAPSLPEEVRKKCQFQCVETKTEPDIHALKKRRRKYQKLKREESSLKNEESIFLRSRKGNHMRRAQKKPEREFLILMRSFQYIAKKQVLYIHQSKDVRKNLECKQH